MLKVAGKRVRALSPEHYEVDDFDGYFLTVEEVLCICTSFYNAVRDGSVQNTFEFVEQRIKELK